MFLDDSRFDVSYNDGHVMNYVMHSIRELSFLRGIEEKSCVMISAPNGRDFAYYVFRTV